MMNAMLMRAMMGTVLIAALAGLAPAQTTQPADPAPAGTTAAVSFAELQLQANQAFAKNDYAAALPLLQQVSQQLSDQPDQLGPVIEQIHVCQRQIKKMAMAAGTATPTPSVIPAGETRTPHPAPVDGKTVDLAIKELGNFDYDTDKGGNIPDDVKRLDGCHFRTHGFMIPLDQAESISQFALVPSLFNCCFGQPPQMQHTIVVRCPKGKALSYFSDELVVEGTLHVREVKDGGFVVSIFDIDATSVRPAAQ